MRLPLGSIPLIWVVSKEIGSSMVPYNLPTTRRHLLQRSRTTTADVDRIRFRVCLLTRMALRYHPHQLRQPEQLGRPAA